MFPNSPGTSKNHELTLIFTNGPPGDFFKNHELTLIFTNAPPHRLMKTGDALTKLGKNRA